MTNIKNSNNLQNTGLENSINTTELNDLLRDQNELVDLGLSGKGFTIQAYVNGMRKNIAFLNKCCIEDVRAIGVQDVINSGSPLILIKLKIIPQEIVVDLKMVKDLNGPLALKILEELEPYFNQLDRHYQNIISSIRHIHSPNLINRFLQKLALIPRPAKSEKKIRSLDKQLGEILELRIIQNILKDPLHERFEEAQKWLNSNSTFVSELENVAQKHFSQTEIKEYIPFYIPGNDSMRDSHFLSYMKEVFKIIQPFEIIKTSEFRKRNEIAYAKRRWRQLRQKIEFQEWSVFDWDNVLKFISQARSLLILISDRNSMIFAALEAEKFLGIISLEEEMCFQIWTEEAYVSWFDFLKDILMFILKKCSEDPAALEKLQRLQLVANIQTNFDSFNNDIFFQLETQLLAIETELENGETLNNSQMKQILLISKNVTRIISILPDHLMYKALRSHVSGEEAFKETHKWYNLQGQTCIIAHRFLRLLKNYSDCDIENLRFLLDVIRPLKYPHFQCLNLAIFKASFFKSKLTKIINHSGRETQVRMIVMLEELRQLPGLASLQTALEARGPVCTDPEDQQLLWLFCVKNNSQLESIRTELLLQYRKELAQASSREEDVSDRFFFESFGLVDYFHDDLQACLLYAENRAHQILLKSEVDQFITHIENLERHILEFTKFRYPQHMKNLIEEILKIHGDLPASLTAQLVKRVQTNALKLESLSRRVCDLFQLLDERHMIGRHYQEHLKIKDVEEIKARYGMVESIPLSYIKQFAIAYRTRREDHKRILKEILSSPQTAPVDLVQNVTHQVYQEYEEQRRLSPRVKLLLLYYYDQFRTQELIYLAYFLNFCLPNRCRKQTTYNSIITMFRENINDPFAIKMLRRIKGKIDSLRIDYQPKVYQRLYQDNYRSLFVDLKDVIGNKLEIAFD